jgi:chromosome segregation ATPase
LITKQDDLQVQGYDVKELEKDLEMVYMQMNLLNKVIPNFLEQIKTKKDDRVEFLKQKNLQLQKQIEQAEELVKLLKNVLYQKLKISFNNNLELSEKNKGLIDKLRDLNDILKNYKNRENELTDLLKQASTEITNLKKQNKVLMEKFNEQISRMKEELENMKEENDILRERINLRTRNEVAPTTKFNLDLRNNY